MENGIVHKLTPEQEELERKKIELATLEKELADKELDLATFQAELNAFEKEYFRIIGVRYTELDRIEAQINDYIALLESSQDFKPSQELKKLYREVAKCIHPDLATDEAERKRRQQLMAEANQAYEDGDEERLQAILHNWQSSPESVKGEGISFELIRIIRQIAQSRERLKVIQEEIEALEQTELYQLKIKIIKAKKVGQDLLADMANELDKQINTAMQKLEELKIKLNL
ncbi:molecular chaperone DnaJ [Pleurocapsales cyanobacterium LEGE 06147]|nr:molecular chaperone DnaJ [Pleurocapsales cyanobacterium LEGE 06147]